MGFRKDSFATVWETQSISPTLTKARVSINRKDKQTDSYVQDFGGYITFVGTACAAKAARLKERDRIKLGDVDVSNRYDKQKNTTYTDFKVFNFELADGNSGRGRAQVDDGEPDDTGDLPF